VALNGCSTRTRVAAIPSVARESQQAILGALKVKLDDEDGRRSRRCRKTSALESGFAPAWD